MFNVLVDGADGTISQPTATGVAYKLLGTARKIDTLQKILEASVDTHYQNIIDARDKTISVSERLMDRFSSLSAQLMESARQSQDAVGNRQYDKFRKASSTMNAMMKVL